MSRADSTSPPPYSYECSSFIPPPPREGQISRSWEFQMRFETAHEDVRWAVLNTLTAWRVHGTGQPWDLISRSEVQTAYDTAPPNLKIALDYITQHNYTTFFSNDKDRRRHLYFSRREAGWPAIGGPRALMTPAQFVRDFQCVESSVQKAVLMSIGWWDQSRNNGHMEPSSDHLCDWYANTTNERKLILNWMLEVCAEFGVNRLEMVPSVEESIRQSFNRVHQSRQKTRSLLKSLNL